MSSHRQLRRRSLAAGRRLVDLIGPTSDAARQSLTALGFNSTSSFVAGLILASALGTFQRYPTLLTLVPAAIGLRGNVMGGMGNRLSTAIHTGTFSLSLRGGTVMGQNVSASLALSSVLSFALAVIASVVGRAFGLEGNINLGQLAMVSIVGGVVASVLVLIATVGLAVLGVRRNWDLDNLVAPSVSTLGDVITVQYGMQFALGEAAYCGACVAKQQATGAVAVEQFAHQTGAGGVIASIDGIQQLMAFAAEETFNRLSRSLAQLALIEQLLHRFGDRLVVGAFGTESLQIVEATRIEQTQARYELPDWPDQRIAE